MSLYICNLIGDNGELPTQAIKSLIRQQSGNVHIQDAGLFSQKYSLPNGTNH